MGFKHQLQSKMYIVQLSPTNMEPIKINNLSDSNSANGHPEKPLKNAKQGHPIARGTRTEETGEAGIVIR